MISSEFMPVTRFCTALTIALAMSVSAAAQTTPVPTNTPPPPAAKNSFGLIDGWKGEASASGSKTTGKTTFTHVLSARSPN